jgi:hypothetical protein
VGRDLAAEVRRLLAKSTDQSVVPTSKLAARAAELAASIRASEVYRRALAEPTCRRSVPLLATVDGVLVDLSLDLLYETPEGTVLVLYDLASDDSAHLDDVQRTMIVRAFEQVTGRSVCAVEVIRVDRPLPTTAQTV